LNKSLHHSSSVKTDVSRRPIAILYEDDQYIVFEKPSGLLVIPAPKDKQKTLVLIVNQQYSAQENIWKLHPCHRIDQETSGAIIFAKGKRNQALMMGLFKRREVTKKYIAFVHGTLRKKYGEFRKPVNDTYRKKFRRGSPAIWAITSYKVIKIKKQFSVVEVRPVTGRTNQIRIHFSQAGYPLVGERKYAFARDYSLKFRRTALHAAQVEWTHPVSRKKICVQSNLPKDMDEFITNN